MAGLSEAEELELLTLEREKAFSSTSGGAATGNPNLRRQGDKALRLTGPQEALLEIGGATAIGGALGAASSEILRGAGTVVGSMPYPAARTVGGAMTAAGDVLKAGGRVVPAVAGALSGAASETAGQVAEGAGAGPVTAEVARLAGGMAGPEAPRIALDLTKKYIATPSLGYLAKIKKEFIRGLVGKIDAEGEKSLTQKERQYLEQVTAELRGGAKTDEPLEAVGNAMSQSGDNASFQADRSLSRANADLLDVGRVAPDQPRAELSDIGGRLRTEIVKRNADMKKANDELYAANEKLRDEVLQRRQVAGERVTALPEFTDMVGQIDASLGAGKRSKDVQVGLKKIRDELTVDGLTFQALDDVRRNLGDVFRGKPPEGYAAIAAGDARRLYAQISEIQKKYAGEAQERLLDDYARGKEGLEPFISAKGRKATALDRYDDKQFATDASALPDTYFKSRASLRALKQLTGDEKLVTEAAMQYVNKKLDGATAKEADTFMRQNSDWLRDLPSVRTAVENYGTKRISRERGVSQAESFVREATSTAEALSGKRFPADRVRNLVQNGNMELWEKAGPAIASSPDGKANVLAAVRQVLADKPMTPDQFNRTVRPALKTSGLADDAAIDIIERKLIDIQEMKIPEKEKLGLYRRAALQATAGYTASGLARGAVEAAKAVPY